MLGGVGGDSQGRETHVAVALRLFVRGTACLVRERGAIPSCWAAATHTHARTHTMKTKIGCPPSPSVEDKSQLNASFVFFVARH